MTVAATTQRGRSSSVRNVGVGDSANVGRRGVLRARTRHRWWLEQLASWIAIPSVSGAHRHHGDLQDAARWLTGCLRRSGASTDLVPSARGGPTVIGRWPGPRGAPVVLLYGHYDVQPAGPGWTVPPFAPTVRGPLFFGRGTNDDKGQLLAIVAALNATGRKLPGGALTFPVTAVLVADGAEEIGSPGLRRALTQLTPTVRPDLILVCDTERSASGAPTITVSQRGHVIMDIAVDSGGPPVHSGRLGGAVIDPANVLVAALTRIGDVVAGWPANAPTPGQRPAVLQLPDTAILRAVHGRATTGAQLHRRITDGAALSITTVSSTGGRGSVAARTVARIDVRLPPRSSVTTAVHILRREAQLRSQGTRVSRSVIAAHPGHAAIPDGAVLSAIDHTSRCVFGRPAVLLRSGGSLPAATMLHRAFGRAPVLLGLGTPAGGAHGPNEFMDIPGWCAAVEMLVMMLANPVTWLDQERGSGTSDGQEIRRKYAKKCS